MYVEVRVCDREKSEEVSLCMRRESVCVVVCAHARARESVFVIERGY